MNKKYWKSFKENWPLMIGHTLVMGFATIILVLFMTFTNEFVRAIDDPYGQTLALIVMMFTTLRILSWIGIDLLNNWANKIHEVFTRR